MAANVKVIPPRDKAPDILRVAAYCRVSSDSSDQLHSYAAQIRNYTSEISKHDGWELVDVYADEGLTGTRMDQREDFNRMLADCRKGKIDKVLVKSISRFSRNTKDCLATLRELTSLGVSVCFEKENINTETLTTELMVSVSGALAQQESISISENQRISYRRRMERGEFITCKAPFGYRLKDGKNLEIVPREAEQVRWIFDAYLSGRSLAWIAEQMTKKGFRTTDDRPYWQETTVHYLLSNEKYVGDSLCQKTFTLGFPFVGKRNHGEQNQYYTERSHPAIISKETFDKARTLLRRRGQRNYKRKEKYPLTLKIVCGSCGTPFIRRTTKNNYVTWVCRKHDDKAVDCPVGRIAETELYAAFVRMYNKLKHHEGIVLKPALSQLNDLNDALQQGNPAILAVNKAIADASEQSYKITTLQTRGLLDTETCAVRLRDIEVRLTELRRERRRLLMNEDIEEVMETLRQTADLIHDGPGRLDSFDEVLFADLVEKIIAESTTRIRFRLYGGIELTEQLWEVGR